MSKRGSTLIELLVTIAVIAIIAAISVPIINSIIAIAEERVRKQAGERVASFVEEYATAGVYTYDPASGVLAGYVDLNGDSLITPK